MQSLLRVDHLSITFSSDAGRHTAVDDLSFTIEPGESLALVGESGSGKSVTALAVLRLLDPRAQVAGSIWFRNENWLQLPEQDMVARRGRDAAMVFQEPMTALNPVMSIGKQIAEAIRVHQRDLSRATVRQRAIEALESVSIPEPHLRFDDYPHQFSGGQRQRILIAMALVNRPSLLIADEPTTALDVTVQAQILELLRELKAALQCGPALYFARSIRGRSDCATRRRNAKGENCRDRHLCPVVLEPAASVHAQFAGRRTNHAERPQYAIGGDRKSRCSARRSAG